MPGMLAIVTRLFFIMGHGSLEVRLEDGRRLVSGCSTAFIIICIIVDSSGLDDIHVHTPCTCIPLQRGFLIHYYNSMYMYMYMYVISSHM